MSAHRMVIETARLPALKAISAHRVSSSSTSTSRPNRLPKGGTAPGTQPVRVRSSSGVANRTPPDVEHPAEPRVVDPPVGGQHEVDRAVVGADHERLGARLERRAPDGGRLRAGADRRVLEHAERHRRRAEPRDETLGERGARVRVFDHRATGAGWSSDRRARAGRAGGPDRTAVGRWRPGAGEGSRGSSIAGPARRGRPGSRGAVPGSIHGDTLDRPDIHGVGSA